MEDRSRTTHENAFETARLLRKPARRKVMLVTDATHLRRTVVCFQAQGIEDVPRGANHRATKFDWTVIPFLPSPKAAVDIETVFQSACGQVDLGANFDALGELRRSSWTNSFPAQPASGAT